MPDDNSGQNKGVEDWVGFGQPVNNNCLNNQKLTLLLSLSLLQWTKLWVVCDDNSAQKQGVEDRMGLRAIITVSTIRN